MTLGMGNRYIDSKGATFGTGEEILGDAAFGAVSAGFGSAISKGSKALPEARQAAQAAAKREAQAARTLTPCMCFPAGTLIATEDGDRPIEDVRVGDRVLSRDPESGEIALRSVLWLKAPEPKPLVAVVVHRADGVEETIRTTGSHPFWVEGKGWTPVDELASGDALVSDRGAPLVVESLHSLDEVATIYNFEVEDAHTYFVSPSHVLVHNAGPCDVYARPSGYRAGVREKVWKQNIEPKTNNVRDPGSGRFMNKKEPWDMGHKPGYEYRKHAKDAAARGLSREAFLDEHNDPSHYRPEDPSYNRSHRGEDKSDTFKGSK